MMSPNLMMKKFKEQKKWMEKNPEFLLLPINTYTESFFETFDKTLNEIKKLERRFKTIDSHIAHTEKLKNKKESKNELN